MSGFKNNTETFSQYLQSMVKLEELQKMTEDLDKELADSQRLMSEIKSIFSNVPNGENVPPLNIDLRREQLAQFLNEDEPQVLLPDMVQAGYVDIENILTGLKNHVDNFKNNIALQENPEGRLDRGQESFNLERYVASLDDYSKRLGNIKLNKANGNRNTVLEMKLGQITEDINSIMKVINYETNMSETYKNGTANQLDDSTALAYANLIKKLLHDTNEALYILQKRI